MAKLKWHGKEITSKIMNELGDRLEVSARMLENEAKEKMSRSNGVSIPGEYPYKQTGHARRNVASEVDRVNLKARWGSNVVYLKFLEIGTRFILPRPWMKLTNRALRKKIERILGAPIE